MSKYTPLEKHLKAESFESIPMTFSEIETLIEDKLPASARKHRAWWSNNPSNSVITYAWLAAGYKTADVSIENERVVFVRNGRPVPDPANDTGRHPVFGCMKNTIKLSESTDLTEPATPEWAHALANAELINE